MPNPLVGLVGSVAGSAISANAQKKSAEAATDAQTEASNAEIAERQRQFDKIQELLSPFVEGGTDAFSGALNLAGVNGNAAQQSAITGIEGSAEFEALYGSAENAILQNASATGGLRGGNTQGALARVRPEILSNLVDEHYGRLQGLGAMGANAASGVGTAAQNLANGTGAALQQQGAAIAGGALARGQATQNLVGGVGRAAGDFATSYADMPEGAGFFDGWGF